MEQFPILSVFGIIQTDLINPDDDPLAIGEGRLDCQDPVGIADTVTDYPRARADRRPPDDPTGGRLFRPSNPPSGDRDEPFPGRSERYGF